MHCAVYSSQKNEVIVEGVSNNIRIAVVRCDRRKEYIKMKEVKRQ